ncbi:MAG: hypothetical protein Q4E59_06855, partial [Bacteroidales bacterium]|nr:hypothetical protein [Bacteroidales bacterium]
ESPTFILSIINCKLRAFDYLVLSFLKLVQSFLPKSSGLVFDGSGLGGNGFCQGLEIAGWRFSYRGRRFRNRVGGGINKIGVPEIRHTDYI